MRTTQVDYKFSIDKNPDIVISTDTELLTFLVSKLGMAFETEMLVTPNFRREPSRFKRHRGRIYSSTTNKRFIVLEQRPTIGSIHGARPTPYAKFASSFRCAQVLCKRRRKVFTIGKKSRAINTLIPRRAFAKHVHLRHIFDRVKCSKFRANEHGTFCGALSSCSSNRAPHDNIGILSLFNRIIAANHRCTRRCVCIRQEFPLALIIEHKRNCRASRFVHAFGRIKQLVKVFRLDKALFTRFRKDRLIVCAKDTVYNPRRHTNTSIDCLHGNSLIDILSGSTRESLQPSPP